MRSVLVARTSPSAVPGLNKKLVRRRSISAVPDWQLRSLTK
jgi:hypothetical protein